jgi:hypothetical protein
VTVKVAGALAHHAAAADFAAVVERVHHRYATEVVGAFRLCPFMRDPETAFGRFVVMLDREPDTRTAAAEVIAAGSQVVHVVYPLVRGAPSSFERFGNEVHQAVARQTHGGPVHATFHPDMSGDARSPARLVGLLRRAPDPFVQFVPEGLHKGGTVFADLTELDLAQLLAQQGAGPRAPLVPAEIERIEATQADIHADRERSYAKHLSALVAP